MRAISALVFSRFSGGFVSTKLGFGSGWKIEGYMYSRILDRSNKLVISILAGSLVSKLGRSGVNLTGWGAPSARVSCNALNFSILASFSDFRVSSINLI